MKKNRWLTFLAALTITVSALGACDFGGASSSSSSDDSTNSSSSSVSGSEDSGSSSGNESSSDNSSTHTHSYTLEKTDETHHWTECECGEATEKVAHVFADKQDETHHWKECECGAQADKEIHTPDPNGDTVITDETHAGTCVCGMTVGATAHEYSVAKSDETYHWMECSCGKVDESTKVEHNYALAQSDETHHWTECECGKATEKVVHGAVQDAEWKTNETHHWKECECGAEVEKGEHAESEAVLNAEKTAFVVTCVGCGKELSQTEAVTISFANCEKEAIVLQKGGVATVVEPERDGYTFGGWHTQDTWGLYAEESTVDLEAPIEADVMLYATWLKDGEDYVQAIHETIALISLVDIAESDVNEYFHYPVTLKTLELNLTEYEAENIQFEDVSAKIAEIKVACGDMQDTAVLFEVKDKDNDTDAYRASLVRSYYKYADAWYYHWEHGGMNPQYNIDNENHLIAEFPIKVNTQRAYIADGENVSFVQEGTENSTRIVDYKFVLRATNFKEICENYGYAFLNARVNRVMTVNIYGTQIVLGVNGVLSLMIDKDGKLYANGDYITELSENVFNGVDNGTDADPEGLTILVTKTTEELYAQMEFSNVLCGYQDPVYEKAIIVATNSVVDSTIDYSTSVLNTEYKMFERATYSKGGVFTGANTFTLPNLEISERGYILFGIMVREADRGVTYKLSYTGENAETVTLFSSNIEQEACMIRVNADGSVLVNGTVIDMTMPESVISGNEQIVLTAEIASASWTNVHMLSSIYGGKAQVILKDKTLTLSGSDMVVTGANGEESYGVWEDKTSIFADGMKINVQAYKVNDEKVKAENFVFTMKKLVYVGYETTFQVAMNQGGKLTFGTTGISIANATKVTITVKADGSVYVDGTVVEGYTLASDVMSGQTAWSFGVFNDTLADDGTSNGTAPYGEFHISKTVSQKVAVTE